SQARARPSRVWGRLPRPWRATLNQTLELLTAALLPGARGRWLGGVLAARPLRDVPRHPADHAPLRPLRLRARARPPRAAHGRGAPPGPGGNATRRGSRSAHRGPGRRGVPALAGAHLTAP